MANLSRQEIENLKRQGYTEEMINKMEPINKFDSSSQDFNQSIEKNVNSTNKNTNVIEKLLKTLEEAGKKINTFTNRETAALEGAGKILQGDFSIIGKSIKKDFIDSSKLFNNQIIKTGTEFASKMGGVIGLVITAMKEADKLIARQAELNKIGYITAGNVDSFFNTRGLEAKFKIQSGMFNSESISDERINKYISEFSKNYSLYGPNARNLSDITQLRSNLQTSLGARGVDESIIEKFTENLIIKQNKSFEDFNNQFKQMQFLQMQSGLSPNKFYDNLNKLMEQGIKFGLTLEEATSYLTKFGKEIDKGTIDIGNLLVYGSTLTNQGVPQSAGLAAQLMQSGNLPIEAMRFAGSPLGLSGWLRANANSSSVQRGIENMVRTEAANSGLSSKEEIGEYFRLRYSQLGYNLNKEQYSKLAEGGSLTAKDLSDASAKDSENLSNLRKDAASIYNNTSSFTQEFKDLSNFLKNAAVLKAGQTMERAISDTKEIISDGKVGETLGYFIKYLGKDWTKFAQWFNNSDRYLEKDNQKIQIEVDVTGKVKNEIGNPGTI